MLELHLHNTTIQQLHKKAKGSVMSFLQTLHEEFAKAEGLKHYQIKILGIHGRYTVREGPHFHDEVLVMFSVAPQAKDGARRWIIEALNARLNATDNSVHESAFGFALRNASIVEGSATSRFATRVGNKQEVTQVSTMMLPIGISAAFTGMLVWLAAA